MVWKSENCFLRQVHIDCGLLDPQDITNWYDLQPAMDEGDDWGGRYHIAASTRVGRWVLDRTAADKNCTQMRSFSDESAGTSKGDASNEAPPVAQVRAYNKSRSSTKGASNKVVARTGRVARAIFGILKIKKKKQRAPSNST